MNLNDLKKIEKLDGGHLAESLLEMPEQIKSVWSEVQKIKLSADYSKINKVIVFGMGGSNLGARIISSVFKKELLVPVIIEAGYEVPGFVDKNTLCILSSYSGNTEETLSVLEAIKNKKAKILAIGADVDNSSLKKIALKEKIIGLFFEATNNPSTQPRAGLGYSLFGLLALLIKAKVLKIDSFEIKNLIERLSIFGEKLNTKVKSNPAKKLAKKLSGQGIVLLGGDFLEGNLHTLRNQFNENSKNFSSYLVLPDMNHYALEGLSFPVEIKKNLAFLVFNSNLCDSRVNRRLNLSKKIIKKNKIKLFEYTLKGKNKLEQSLEMLSFGAWLTFYLGISNEINPSLIPWVDWLKKNMR